MKKSKYLVLSAAAVLAVGCGGGKMPKIEDEVAVTTADKIIAKQAETFMGAPSVDEEDITKWYEWEAPKKYVSVTATDTTHAVRHNPGEYFSDNTRTVTRTTKYDLEAHRIQYIYDANFYTDAAGYYHPGEYHAQYDYVWTPGTGLWCCSDINGERYKTKADWGWLVNEDLEPNVNYQVISNVKDADAWIKYAYVHQEVLTHTFFDELIAPIPSARHYICGFDDMMDYFINWGDLFDLYNTVTDMGWYGLIYEDFSETVEEAADIFDIGYMNEIYYQTELDRIEFVWEYLFGEDTFPEEFRDMPITFDTFAQFVQNSITISKLYNKDFKEKGGEDFGEDSYAKAEYFSNDKEKNLAGDVAYRLDYKKEASVTTALPAYYYGLDYSFNYADNYLTKSDVKYYVDEEYLNEKGAKTEYCNQQSGIKSVNISYDKPSFKDVNLTEYETYNYIAGIL